MKSSFVEHLQCPFCRSAGLETRIDLQDDREIRSGGITCRACDRHFPIREGILDTLDPQDEVIAREIKGWIELAGPLGDGLVTTMTALPYYPHDPWPQVAPDFFQLFEHLDFAGANIVDIGAGRAWSSRFLATIGRAAQVVAVDVLTTRFVGLETADLFFSEDHSHFERICGDVHHLPLRDGWADVVFSCAAIHHSGDPGGLFREAHRVLKPGGTVAFVSEPCKKASIPGNTPTNEETEHGINEHIYSYEEYVEPLRGLGFRIRRLAPRSLRYRLIYRDSGIEQLLPGWMLRLGKGELGRSLIQGALPLPLLGPLLYRFISLPLSIIAVKEASS